MFKLQCCDIDVTTLTVLPISRQKPQKPPDRQKPQKLLK